MNHVKFTGNCSFDYVVLESPRQDQYFRPLNKIVFLLALSFRVIGF